MMNLDGVDGCCVRNCDLTKLLRGGFSSGDDDVNISSLTESRLVRLRMARLQSIAETDHHR